MNIITYSITLLEPLMVPSIDGDPNSGISYPYVPGSSLRGSMVAAYIRHTGIDTLDAGTEKARRLFFDGRTRYLNAYPVVGEGKRVLPTPLSWYMEKGEKSSIFDFAVRTDYDLEQPQRVRSEERPFCWLDDGEVEFHGPARQINVHTSRDRAKGRAREGAGTVFQYDALAAGERFGGVILAEEEHDAKHLSELLTSASFFLGGSHNTGYGRVRVDEVKVTTGVWREVPGTPLAISPGDSFVVTSVSDAIVRHPTTGQYSTDVRLALGRLLGVTLESIPLPSNPDDEEQRNACRAVEVGGFNRKWGLPLPQALAIQAGSAFVFTSQQPISAEILRQAEWRGVGERRAEGFGRLVFGWQSESRLVLRETLATPERTELPVLEGLGQVLAQRMVERLLRRDLDEALRQRVNALSIENPPTNAQISRLRVIARGALATGDVERIGKLLESIETRKSSHRQFGQARVGTSARGPKPRLIAWLRERLQQPESVWTELPGARNVQRRLAANVSERAVGNDSLAREYTIRLIDGVLAKAVQERRQRGED